MLILSNFVSLKNGFISVMKLKEIEINTYILSTKSKSGKEIHNCINQCFVFRYHLSCFVLVLRINFLCSFLNSNKMDAMHYFINSILLFFGTILSLIFILLRIISLKQERQCLYKIIQFIV